jgi:dihydrofolate reductase
MAKLRLRISISLDGYVAGPNQSVQNPLGEGGMRLHEWVFPLAAWRAPHGMEGGIVDQSSPVLEEVLANIGATIMGRNMFGPVRGDWGDLAWQGWWGEEPPFHHPVVVLTHHPRPPLHMAGGTTFTFVTDGIESALEQAVAGARGGDVRLGGGPATIRQYLRAGLVDELSLAVVPVLLGGGEPLFDPRDGLLPLVCTEHENSPAVTHYRLVPAPGISS